MIVKVIKTNAVPKCIGVFEILNTDFIATPKDMNTDIFPYLSFITQERIVDEFPEYSTDALYEVRVLTDYEQRYADFAIENIKTIKDRYLNSTAKIKSAYKNLNKRLSHDYQELIQSNNIKNIKDNINNNISGIRRKCSEVLYDLADKLKEDE